MEYTATVGTWGSADRPGFRFGERSRCDDGVLMWGLWCKEQCIMGKVGFLEIEAESISHIDDKNLCVIVKYLNL